MIEISAVGSLYLETLLEGSWVVIISRVIRGLGFRVVISRVISRVTILITHIRGLITPPITTPEPPSKPAHELHNFTCTKRSLLFGFNKGPQKEKVQKGNYYGVLRGALLV